jgi:hypothetical protein
MSIRSLEQELDRIDEAFKQLEERRTAVVRRLEKSSSGEQSPTNLILFPETRTVTVIRRTSTIWPMGTSAQAEDEVS